MKPCYSFTGQFEKSREILSLKWGPIIWGLIGLAAGASAGFMIELIINRKKLYRKQLKNKPKTEVVLMVHCNENQAEMVEYVLFNHFALGVAKVHHS